VRTAFSLRFDLKRRLTDSWETVRTAVCAEYIASASTCADRNQGLNDIESDRLEDLVLGAIHDYTSTDQ
jgi:hypothetical protein